MADDAPAAPALTNDSGPRLAKPGHAFLIMFLVPALASAIILVAVGVLKDEETAVAVSAGAAIGFVVVVASAVTLSAVAHDVRRSPGQPQEPVPARAAGAADDGLSISQGVVLLLTFVILTAVPASVVVGAAELLKRGGNLLPEFALPVILIVGLIGLLAVLAMMVAVFRRFELVSKEFPLGLPEGSIQAVIALSLILIFAIIGVYLHASAEGERQDDLSTQLLTTVSTLVVAVAGFYFGSKTTKEAADAARAAGGLEATTSSATKPPLGGQQPSGTGGQSP